MRDRAAPAGGVAASGIYATGLTGGPSPLSGCGWECRSAVPPPRGHQRPPTPRALVHHQEVSVLPRHDRQATTGPHRHPISTRGGPPAHPRRNPRRPAGLGAGSGVTAKVEASNTHPLSNGCTTLSAAGSIRGLSPRRRPRPTTIRGQTIHSRDRRVGPRARCRRPPRNACRKSARPYRSGSHRHRNTACAAISGHRPPTYARSASHHRTTWTRPRCHRRLDQGEDRPWAQRQNHDSGSNQRSAKRVGDQGRGGQGRGDPAKSTTMAAADATVSVSSSEHDEAARVPICLQLPARRFPGVRRATQPK